MNTSMQLQDLAYHYIRELITHGQFDTKRTYSETKTATALGLSRTPVHRALSRLEQEGYIKSHPTKGYRILSLNRRDIEIISQIRSAIEGYSAYFMAQDCGSERFEVAILELESILREQEAMLEEPEFDFNRFAESDNQFHLRIIQYVNNPQFLENYKAYQRKIQEARRQYMTHAERPPMVLDEHRTIIGLLKEGASETVFRFVVAHSNSSTLLLLQDILQFQKESGKAVSRDDAGAESYYEALRHIKDKTETA